MWKNGGPIQDYSGSAELTVTGAAGASFISPGAFFTHPALSVSVKPFLTAEEFNEANGAKAEELKIPEAWMETE